MSRITDYILEPEVVYTEGGFLVRVKVQDDYKYKKYIVSENLHYKTVQGTSFTLTDAQANKQASILELKGDTRLQKLPDNYQEVEYIESTGTQYIDTSISTKANTSLKFKTEIEWNNISSRQVMGANYGGYFGVSAGYYEIDNTRSTIVPSQNNYDKVEYNYNNGEMSLTVNSNTFNKTSTVGTGRLIGIFHLGNYSALLCNVKMKYFMIYENDILVGNFVPCYRKSDNVIGMYDTVGKTFYTNAGTGTFTKGADVTTVTPTPNTPADIITVSGDNNIVVSNKNLFDVEQSITKVENRAGTVDTSWGSYENGIVTMNRSNGQKGVRIFSGQPIFLCSNKTYTLSVDCFLTGTATANGVHFGLCDLNNSNEAIQENNFSLDAKETWQRISLTVTPTQNYLRVGTIIQALNSGNVLQMKNIQIEQGGQATTYIEHEGDNYNINLGDNSPILPIDYQEVEYIESTGTQSLDTGVIGNYTNNLTIKAKLQLLRTKGSENAIMGNKNSSNQGTTIFFPQNSSNLRTWSGSGTTWNIANLTLNEDTEIEISFTVPSGRSATINNTSYTSTRANNVTSNDTSFAIFNDKPSTVLSPSFLRVYYYEIYIDNVKKCQLIPCYRKSDNVIGMYDLVTNTFKTHIGTENFIKGNNVYHNPIELCKIGNYQDKLLQSKGNNLWFFNSDNWDSGYSTSYVINSISSLSVTSTNSAYANTKFKINLEDGTYTFSLGSVTNSNSSMTTKRMTVSTYTNGTRAVVQHIDMGTPRTVTITNADNKQYVLEFWASYSTALVNTATFSNVMINKGTTALPYEPYGVGKWYIEKNIGKHEIESSDIALISTYWYSTYGVYGAGISKDVLNIAKTSTDKQSLCNIASKVSAIASIGNGKYIFNANVNYVFFFSNTSDTLDKAKAELTGGIIYYNLDTPTYTEITDTYLLNQLNNILDIDLYDNLCYVDWVGIEKPTMTLQYAGTEDLGIKYIITEDGTKIRTDWRKLGRRKNGR